MNITRSVGDRFHRLYGFTLIEVVLAIGITIGMLGVVLFFYKQASNLRLQMLKEAEAISSARLVMDRLTAELRCATALDTREKGLLGEPNSIVFTSMLWPQISWTAEDAIPSTVPQSDLARIRYALIGSLTNANGLERSQDPIVKLVSTNAVETSSETAGPDLDLEEESGEFVEPAANDLLLTEHLRFLRLRYWNGAGWQDQWNSWTLPKGVEVTLGREALPAEIEPADYPFEVFRRVIYLPGSEAPSEELGWLDFLEAPEEEPEEDPL